MKILELRFKNLNSLYGEWLIDFTVPEYAGNAIFALTGPTGSGKSTILDAICLALYGATPRLGKITKSSNEIMSRQTGECFAEVLFESQAGRFRCHWEQHRARRKPDGELQNPAHEIAQGKENGQVIENKIRTVAAVIEDKTGMDFDRFTRSILLAQGGFDTFLKADSEQKSKILEQITGTKIYSEISIRVHERLKAENNQLDILLAETRAIQLLDPDEEKALAAQLQNQQQDEKSLNQKVEQTKTLIDWFKGIDQLNRDIAAIQQASDELKAEQQAFKPEQEKLDRAIRAVELEGEYARLAMLRKDLAANLESLTKAKDLLPSLQKAREEAEKAWRDISKVNLEIQQEQKTALPVISRVRSLDEQIQTIELSVQKLKDDYLLANDLIRQTKAELKSDQDKLDLTRQDKTEIDRYLTDNQADAWLVGGLTGVQEQIRSLQAGEAEIRESLSDIGKCEASLNQVKTSITQLNQHKSNLLEKSEQADRQVEQQKSEYDKILGGRLLRELRADVQSLYREIGLKEKIAALEHHRMQLEDNKPCPLCGSLQHPYAEGNVPTVDADQKRLNELEQTIQSAEQCADRLQAQESAKAELAQKVLQADQSVAKAKSLQSAEQTRLQSLNESLDRKRSAQKVLHLAILAKLKPLGISDFTEEDAQKLLTELKQRLERWQQRVADLAAADLRGQSLEASIRQLKALLETHQAAVEEKSKALHESEKNLDKLIMERHELFGDRKPDQEIERLDKAVETLNSQELAARDQLEQKRQQLQVESTRIESLDKQIADRRQAIEGQKSVFDQLLATLGFSDEAAFTDARMPSDQRSLLQDRSKQLDKRQAEIAANYQDRLDRLALEKSKFQPGKTPIELEAEQQTQLNTLNLLREDIASIRNKLQSNQDARAKVKARQRAIDDQKKEFLRWEKLHLLIGSADGKKFRNFAQGLTFELLVSHANRQLVRMSDRYLLIRSLNDPLELDVVDNYQAGEIRSTRNLSGGESFLTSLALALGLSRMASRKVRVDSLFLDEGFGTLDEDALETALETLAGLQQDGKLIGVISHVNALKERIRTQIAVSPASGGKSRLTGPGCSQVETAGKSQ